jgi:cytoskeletal protein CcmA (bactofilin family)
LDGEVQTKGESIVGEDGMVQGTIFAGTLISSGRIKATVTATERIQLLKTAILIGEVHCPVLSMEDGAKFQGASDMGVTAWAEEAPRAPVAVRELPAHRKVVPLNGKEADL